MSEQEYDRKALTGAQQAAIGCEAMRNITGQVGDPFGLAAYMSKNEKKRHKAKLDETRQLTGRFRDYVTEVAVSSPCERIDSWPLHLFKHQAQGVDLDQFREDCKGIDEETK